ncbi:hypothetical protein EYF80_066249 [Liparis tanakae]|uniref:Uncharacterized protein n=1 Tax=Liparis tanakae TaxID=230148 RepID=A0A4Z2E4E7_9TELE|nr:hypothetical protein EYF80_066249 [Liparis tanakae]
MWQNLRKQTLEPCGRTSGNRSGTRGHVQVYKPDEATPSAEKTPTRANDKSTQPELALPFGPTPPKAPHLHSADAIHHGGEEDGGHGSQASSQGDQTWAQVNTACVCVPLHV